MNADRTTSQQRLTYTGARNSAVVVSTHHLASQAGTAVLRAGGNAVDAAVAANAVLGVVRPDTCGPGGDLFALIHRPGQERPLALNASGRAGSGASAADLRHRGLDAIPLYGPESITVPGCVDGWFALIDELGTFDIGDVLSPAIDLADDGFPVSAELADSLVRLLPRLAEEDAAQSMYPDGQPPESGTTVRRPDHAASLRTLATRGRDAFYSTVLGDGLTRLTNGAITADDLVRRQDEWVEPLGLEIVGTHGWTTPPNSQGYLVLAALWLAERMLPVTGPDDPAFQHILIESYRAAAEDRDDVAVDPVDAPFEAADLLDADRLDDRLSTIDRDRAASFRAPSVPPGGTMHLVAHDANGWGVSLIQSNFHGIGTARGIDGTGIFLHNRGAGFNLVPGHPNEIEPGRRPLHTLSPTLWTAPGGALEMLMGTRGGHYQPQILLQVLARMLFADAALAEAIAAPRWVIDNVTGPGHTVRMEGDHPTNPDQLRSRGHAVTLEDGPQRGWGPVAAIQVVDDRLLASGDPRVSTSGVAVA